MPDYRHHRKKAKKTKDKQKTPKKQNPVNYDKVNIEVGKIMKENERKRKTMLKDVKEQMEK